MKKDDGKVGFAGKGKDAAKKIVLEQEANEMKIHELFPLDETDFSKDVKINYSKIDVTGSNNMENPKNAYYNNILDPFVSVSIK